MRNVAWLDDQGVDGHRDGCNTSCAIAERYGWPSTRAPVLDLIDSAATAVQRAGYRRIGVVATAATVAAGSYGRTLRSAVPGAEIWEVAAPQLVPMVEAGEIGAEARDAVDAVCTETAAMNSMPWSTAARTIRCSSQHFLRRCGEKSISSIPRKCRPSALPRSLRDREPFERARNDALRHQRATRPRSQPTSCASWAKAARTCGESVKDGRRERWRRTASS